MPADREELYAEMAESRRRADEATRAERRRAAIRAGVQCVAWSALGIFMIGWSIHTTDQRWARVVFLGGIAVGNSGIVATLLRLQAAFDRIEHS
jgi:hypothetical protein